MRRTALRLAACALAAAAVGLATPTAAEAACVPVTVNASLGVSVCASYVAGDACVAVYYETPVTGPGYDNIGPVCVTTP